MTDMMVKGTPFMKMEDFDSIVLSGDQSDLWGESFSTQRQVAMDIVTRWAWLIRGTVELPFALLNGDLFSDARRYIQAADGSAIPAFPMSPRNYPKTKGEAYALIPAHLRDQIEAPEEPDAILDWRRVTECQPRNLFEEWLFEQERRVYFEEDPLADRRIRALWLGYALHRSKYERKDELVWQATQLPIPVLTRWVRTWTHVVDRPDPYPIFGVRPGRENDMFNTAELRNQAIQLGLGAIDGPTEVGWPRYADSLANMSDWQFTLDISGGIITMRLAYPGMVMIAEDDLPCQEMVELDGIQEILEAATEELTNFGFKVNPVNFTAGEPEPEAQYSQQQGRKLPKWLTNLLGWIRHPRFF